MDCYAHIKSDILTIGNSIIERQWQIKGNHLYAISLLDKTDQYEWIVSHYSEADSTLPELYTQVLDDSLIITILNYRFRIFANFGAIQMTITPHNLATGQVNQNTNEPTGIETQSNRLLLPEHDCIDRFELSPLHAKLTQVKLRDKTDINNNLCSEEEWLLHSSERQIRLQGNLFFLQNTLSDNGLIFLKHAPLPESRTIQTSHDLIVDAQNVRSSTPSGYEIAVYGEHYTHTIMTYQQDTISVLHEYQHRLNPAAHQVILSNTWGNRSQDSRINEAFVRLEIEAGAAIGVEVVQIDDGWEQGITANSTRGTGVWSGFYASDPNFWEPNKDRFPNGLRPVVDYAAEHGVQIGLWFAPDTLNDYVTWEKDIETLLNLYQQYGIKYFKFDAIKLDTHQTEINLKKMLDRIYQASSGEIVIDLDITAEERPGYFGAVGYGPLFLENRYTDFHNYWPHQTLRNFWQLSHYIDPLRLRLEILDNSRNQQIYTNDPLAPGEYTADYLFATVMFANPLVWLEMSNLSDDYATQLQKIIRVWKNHRQTVFSDQIRPIGNIPDGTSWTGFVSDADYILIFREYNTQSHWVWPVPTLSNGQATILSGSGTASVHNQVLTVDIPQPQQYLFAQL